MDDESVAGLNFSSASARRATPVLIRYTLALLRIARSLHRRHISSYPTQNSRAIMALCYSRRMIDQLQSIVNLVMVDRERDAGLLAGSMFEGLTLLLWERGPELWRKYFDIVRWRGSRSGKVLTEDETRELETRIHATGGLFYTAEAHAAAERGGPLPADPFRSETEWHGRTLRDICAEVDAKEIDTELVRQFDALYSQTQEWSRWSPAAFQRAMRRTKRGVQYSSEDPKDAASGLVLGFQALAGALIVLCDELELEQGLEVAELQKEVGSEMQKRLGDARRCEGPWIVCCAPEQYEALKSTISFHQILALARLVNSLRFVHIALLGAVGDDSPRGQRQTVQALCFSNALLHEGLLFSTALDGVLRRLPSYKNGLASLHRDPEVQALQRRNLAEFRNVMFHVSTERMAQQLAPLKGLDFTIFSAGYETNDQMCYVLSDLTSLRIHLRNVEDIEAYWKEFRALLDLSTDATEKFLKAADDLIADALTAWEFKIELAREQGP